MNTDKGRWWLGGLVAGMLLSAAGGLPAQTTMPSTLRYGSGLFDVPVATVLPHLAVTATYSGFNVDVSRRLIVDDRGVATGYGEPFSKWMSDASVAIGLFDRVELGATFQSFGDADKGGTMAGAFGRVTVVTPDQFPLAVALGARVVTAPSFDAIDPNGDFQPTRLGFPDSRFHKSYTGRDDEVNTVFTPYAVATANLMGAETRFLPRHDLTLTFGWGSGMFSEGDDLTFYTFNDSKGWFAGGALHVGLADAGVLHLMGEYNGFDVNVGAQLDWSGVRVGAFILGANYGDEISEYRSMKVGILGSLAVCPASGGLCKPALRVRPAPDTVQLPPPPPDTVVIERTVEPPLPTGRPATLCLATGEDVEVLIGVEGDTLVGPKRVSVRTLRPALVFPGVYAGEEGWFTADEEIRFQRRRYAKFGEEVQLRCADIMKVGEYRGVPLFTDAGAEKPFDKLYVPVRPGIWQEYRYGVGRTRG